LPALPLPAFDRSFGFFLFATGGEKQGQCGMRQGGGSGRGGAGAAGQVPQTGQTRMQPASTGPATLDGSYGGYHLRYHLRYHQLRHHHLRYHHLRYHHHLPHLR
jgi:hypothetical protein